MRMIYATRSVLPSKTANSVQSAHMVDAFNKVIPHIPTIYRTGDPGVQASDHFNAYDLSAPSQSLPIPLRLLDDVLHAYLMRLFFCLRRLPEHDLVYTRSTRMAWVAIACGKQPILELHDPLIPIRIRFLKKNFEQQRLKLLVVTTDRLKRDVVREVGIPRENILVAGGAAESTYADLPAAPLDQSLHWKHHVAYAGSALKGKGLDVALGCASQMPDVAFHLIGPTEADCLRVQSLPPNIILHGYQSGREVISLLKSMHVLLLPNQTSVIIRSGADIGQHTSPLKMFEYMATGRPIVASDLPVLHPILRHQENALCVPPTEVSAFCTAIRRLLNDAALSERLAAQALTEFKESYTWDHRVAKIVGFLHQHGFYPEKTV